MLRPFSPGVGGEENRPVEKVTQETISEERQGHPIGFNQSPPSFGVEIAVSPNGEIGDQEKEASREEGGGHDSGEDRITGNKLSAHEESQAKTAVNVEHNWSIVTTQEEIA